MAVDEQARHRLHQKLEQVLGAEEAGILMDHLPPRGFGDLATKGDLQLLRAATKADLDVLRAEQEALRHELLGAIDRSARHLMVWVSSMVLATGALAFTAGRFV
jgi:hypothetical protein